MSNPRLWRSGGIAGCASICCYAIAVLVPWPEGQLGNAVSLLFVSAFPILGIVAAFALCAYLAAFRDTVSNRLSLVFAVAAFTTLLAMLLAQLAVVSGVKEVAQDLAPATERALRRALRLVDLGLDVAWDLLIGTTLILWGVALRTRSTFGPAWAYPSLVFGVALIGLNVATFPWPPATRGLVDIGPFIALFMFALNARLAFLGLRALRGAGPEAAVPVTV